MNNEINMFLAIKTNHASSRIKGTRTFSTTIVTLFDMPRAPLEAWLDCWVWSLHVQSREIRKDWAIGRRIEFLHWNAASSLPRGIRPQLLARVVTTKQLRSVPACCLPCSTPPILCHLPRCIFFSQGPSFAKLTMVVNPIDLPEVLLSANRPIKGENVPFPLGTFVPIDREVPLGSHVSGCVEALVEICYILCA